MSEKITFKELVELIASQSDQSRSSANSFIHELVKIIESGLKQGGSVSISGFGKFELRWMKERPGVNPQTGDEITIPGQNKVVFKPFKSLRETVNKPYSDLESRVLDDENESKESSASDDELNDDEHFTFLPPEKDSLTPAEDAEEDPFGLDKDTEEVDPFLFGESEDDGDELGDLIYERDHPYADTATAQAFVETATKAPKASETEKTEAVSDKVENDRKPTPVLPDESKLAAEAQKSGSYKWSYAAAVIIVMIAFIILFFMMQRSDETASITSGDQSGEQTEQVITPPADETVSDAESSENLSDLETGQQTTSEAETGESATDDTGETAPESSEPSLETFEYSVESGQSLWTIAESELGNPYLWPLIYHLNKEEMGNPNQITANSSLQIPSISDPDNLSEFEREQVAQGYFSLYEWNRENNPSDAQYFLWAVGVFSQDLLENPPSEVNAEDLEFARNR